MLIPIYTVDLHYYKKMFWHLNEKANKTKEEEDKISKDLCFSLVEKAFAFMEEIFNNNNTLHYDSLLAILEEYKFEGNLVDKIETELMSLREKVQKLGWDYRIKVSVRERKLANAFQTIYFFMDLDATMEANKLETDNKTEEVYESPFNPNEVIDNPSMEQLNEWFLRNPKNNEDQETH